MTYLSEISQSATQYTEDDLRATIKPLPRNAFAQFFARIYRKWLEIWYAFADRHKKGAELLQKALFFLVFSVGVTIWQYVVMTFLPLAFASLNNGAWGWPNLPVSSAGGQPYVILGDAQGLGYFIAFEIAVFTAQCINFPLQRNVTYRSHGNVYVQALWYFIGWVLVSLFTNALWGIINCFFIHWKVPNALTGLVKTLLTGMLSMVVFFFIFLIIFPDNAKLAQKTRSRCERARSRGDDVATVAKLEEKALLFEQLARVNGAERALAKAKSCASAAAIRYFSLKPNDGETGEDFSLRKQSTWNNAIEAMENLRQAQADMLAVEQ